MIPMDLTSYVKLYQDMVPKQLCADVLAALDSAEWERHAFYYSKTETRISSFDDLLTSSTDVPNTHALNRCMWLAIERYVLQDFAHFEEWFNGWNGHTSVRFNRYDPSTRMRLHCDHIHSMFDGAVKGIPTLSVLAALNDDYEGGEFMMFGDRQYYMPAGSVLVFPSSFMFPHEVLPVKSGVRYTCVSWAW